MLKRVKRLFQRLKKKKMSWNCHHLLSISRVRALPHIHVIFPGCCSGETGAWSPCPVQKETHRGRLHPRLDGVCPRTGAQQHSALCGESCFSPARKLPQTKKRWEDLLFRLYFWLQCLGFPVGQEGKPFKTSKPGSKTLRSASIHGGRASRILAFHPIRDY